MEGMRIILEYELKAVRVLRLASGVRIRRAAAERERVLERELVGITEALHKGVAAKKTRGVGVGEGRRRRLKKGMPKTEGGGT